MEIINNECLKLLYNLKKTNPDLSETIESILSRWKFIQPYEKIALYYYSELETDPTNQMTIELRLGILTLEEFSRKMLDQQQQQPQ